jgi:hydroxyacylglutathione hydrolase
MKLVALPAFTDNYIWMLHNGRQAIVVDPGDPTPVKTALQDLNLSLEAILVTHHHPDHIGGIEDLKSLCPGQVYGPSRHAIDGVDVKVHDGQQIHLLDHVFTAWDTPGHTAGHVSYTVVPHHGLHQGQTLLWCGDTLFSAGCGRIFCGTAEQFVQSLSRINTLGDDTLVCCAHEYTLSNLQFAATVEPDQAPIREAWAHCTQLRSQGLPTLPARLGLERQINPFLRLHQPAVMAQALSHGAPDTSPVSVFSALRQWKNEFRA